MCPFNGSRRSSSLPGAVLDAVVERVLLEEGQLQRPVRQRRARGKKKTAKAKRKVKEGAWEGKGHWTYLRLTADEEDPEKIEEIRRKMSS